jgi:hypothetical protein
MLARGSLLRPGSGGAENTSQSTMGEARLSDFPTFVVPRSKHHQHLQAAVAADNNTPRRPGGIASSPRSKRERPRMPPKKKGAKSRKNLTPYLRSIHPAVTQGPQAIGDTVLSGAATNRRAATNNLAYSLSGLMRMQ